MRGARAGVRRLIDDMQRQVVASCLGSVNVCEQEGWVWRVVRRVPLASRIKSKTGGGQGNGRQQKGCLPRG